MKHQEAKLILRTHRADGRYRPDDPLFADALAGADKDPVLAEWLAREHAVDAVVAHKLDGIQPPADLRQSILVGARASRLRRRGWRRPLWLAAAAALVIAATLPAVIRLRGPAAVDSTAFGEFSLAHLATAHEGHAGAPGALAIATALATAPRPLSTSVSLDVDQLRTVGCQRFDVFGREVFEICFEREGTWYHLYVMRGDARTRLARGTAPLVLEHDGAAAAVWASADTVYSLVTRSGASALRTLL
ncbi:MAG: hypothetical protein IAE82_20810 [Opitutaceae bacterium]|nr:hypothetical protein [Opitutaceae bacterium]